MKYVKYPKITTILVWLVGIFVIMSGIGTSVAMSPEVAEEGTALKAFYQALADTNYMFIWIGLFKVLTGVLLIIPRTRKLAAIMLLPYSINILLYSIFIGPMFIPMALVLCVLNIYLLYAHWAWYKPVFE